MFSRDIFMNCIDTRFISKNREFLVVKPQKWHVFHAIFKYRYRPKIPILYRPIPISAKMADIGRYRYRYRYRFNTTTLSFCLSVCLTSCSQVVTGRGPTDGIVGPGSLWTHWRPFSPVKRTLTVRLRTRTSLRMHSVPATLPIGR